MGPRRTVAPAKCISRAFCTMASYSGLPSKRSSSPKKMRNSTASLGTCICILLDFARRRSARDGALALGFVLPIQQQVPWQVKCIGDQSRHDRAANDSRNQSGILRIVDDAVRQAKKR